MGLKYLWDTNTVIYYLKNSFTGASQEKMNTIINRYRPAISAITEIELLCWKTATNSDLTILNSFIADCLVVGLDKDVKLKTIDIRENYSLKLPDAIIAATAFSMDLILISNDKRGFDQILSLKLLNLR
jgi:predicted nucleic acid-binding protein